MKRFVLSVICLTLSFLAYAQDSALAGEDRQATGLRAEGKIYVVLVVSVIILIGLFIYLIRLDRKITRMEKGS